MGNYMLCSKPAAKTPFYIESVQLNIYSIEELSYFLGNFLPLVDESIINDSLGQWLSDECHMTSAKDSIHKLLGEDNGVVEGLKYILKEGKYYTALQLDKLCDRINEMQVMSAMDKRKVRADLLMRNKKYRSAVNDYEEILKTPGITGESKEFRMKVYYNLGCAYAKLFRLSKAKIYFRKAYEVMPDENTQKATLAAAYIEGGKEGFEREVERLKVTAEERYAVLNSLENVEMPEIKDDIYELGKKWVKDYHDKTGL